MGNYYPEKYFITSGWGKSTYKLVAFDEALRNAQIADYNLIKISSILPTGCKKSTAFEMPQNGLGILTAFGSITSNEKGVLIASAVAAAIPEEPDEVGVIMEYAGNCTAQYAEEQVRLMVKEAMDNRNRKIKEIQSSSIEKICAGNGYESVISAVCIW